MESEEKGMRKQQVQYTSSLDALIAVAKRLSLSESQHNMESEDFFDRYTKGQLCDEAIFIDWANDYRHYCGLRQEIEKHLPTNVIASPKPDLKQVLEEASKILNI